MIDNKKYTYISRNIYKEETIYYKDSDTKELLIRKIEKLRITQKIFSSQNNEYKFNLLSNFANKIYLNREILAAMICEEVGRNILQCYKEIDRSINLIDHYISIADKLLEDKIVDTDASISKVMFEPLGIIFAVTPWNYPIWQIIRFVIPNLCVGNGCLIKPAPSVVRLTEKFFSLVDEEIPLLATYLENNDVELAIANTEGLIFTGSVVTGRKLASIAGKHLKKTVLELGGSNAQIILDDAGIKFASRETCLSRFRDSGQSCNAIKRVILLPSIVDDYINRLKEECIKLKMGDPSIEDNTLVPLHKKDATLVLQNFVNDAVNKGAKCILGGKLPKDTKFYPATILDNVKTDCLVAQDEVFGPIISIFRAKDIDDAIDIVNSSQYGIGASIYTQDMELASLLAKKLMVGSVFVNRYTSSELKLPFGGVKNSGYGRELSEFGLFEFVNIKTYWQK